MSGDDLHPVKDDMTAFIEGHGMRRFPGYVGDEMPSVLWKDNGNPDAWKDFVEFAKASSVSFVTMSHVDLDKEDVDLLINRLQEIEYMSEEDLEEANWLRSFVGKVGYLQLGFPCQGVMFLYEVATPWYETYQRLESAAGSCEPVTEVWSRGSTGKASASKRRAIARSDPGHAY